MTASIAGQLRNASWRGIEFPFTGSRDFGFQQDQAQHRFIFRDQQLIESLGRQNPTFRYTIPFRENIRREPWKHLFVEVYPKFLDACQDRSAGELVDPIHGTFRAKCVSLQETLSVDATDGVEVVAEFIYAPEDGDSEPVQFAQLARTLPGLAESAIVFGANVGNISKAQRDLIASLNKKSERPETSILGAARKGATFVQQTKNRTRAQLSGAASELDTTRKQIEQARDPELEPLRRDVARLSLSSRELAKTAGDPTTPTDIVQTTTATGRMALAAVYGVTVDVLLELNPSFADLQIIPAGTPVKLPKNRG